MKLSPIVLFVYNRPEHAYKVLKSLKSNFLANQSEIYIFSDFSKNKDDKKSVKKVRKMIQNFNGFKKKNIILRKKNLGLANNFISGITQLLKKYDRLIILEDDNYTSPYFLTFMNDALEMYKNSKKVGAISGYSYNLNIKKNKTFFSTYVPSWGWGTWKKSWKLMNLDGKYLKEQLLKLKKISEFNLNNSYDFIRILNNQIEGKNNSWSIRWYASLFLKKKLVLFSTKSYVHNIGNDGYGIHTPSTKFFDVDIADEYKKIKKIKISVNKLYNKKINNFYLKLKRIEYIIYINSRIKLKLKKFFN